ncbi:uncharacterized protein [Miscanthus floridulus]|uniref:uncharacterized protein n=1 Tax=Miscanthus floridulus TaxID=154761 RepID=UPI003458D256
MEQNKRAKVLCLHGFRTSGSFLKKQISKWHPSIFQQFEMVFPDGFFPAGGKSLIEGIFPLPYFEWFQFNNEFTEYTNLDECISYLCDYMVKNRPFDGLLGFFQGKVLRDHPPIKFMVSISGCKFRDPSICDVVYKDPIKVKSVHFIGEKDWLKVHSEELASVFDEPLIIRHPQGHTVPRLDDVSVKQLSEWSSSCVLEDLKSADVMRHSGKPSDKEATGVKFAENLVKALVVRGTCLIACVLHWQNNKSLSCSCSLQLKQMAPDIQLSLCPSPTCWAWSHGLCSMTVVSQT